MFRRRFLQLAVGGAAAWGSTPLLAQGSTQPLRIVVGFAPGGSTDIVARLVADGLKRPLGRTVLVENKSGASGRLAIEMVKSAPPDGTLLVLAPHGAMTLFPHIYKSLRYDPGRDFTPISRVVTGDYCLAVSAQSPATDIASFKRWGKEQGDRLSFGSPGAGTVLHFLGLQIGQGLGLSFTHVPYRGAAPALTDLIGGVVSATVTPLADVLEMHKAGKIRILATTGAARTRIVDGIPTLKESGVNVDVSAWLALYGPAGMQASAVEALQRAIQQVLETPAVQERLVAMGMVAAPTNGAQLAALERAESALWASVVKTSGFTPQD